MSGKNTHNTISSLMTSQMPAAVATVRIVGKEAAEILTKIFIPQGKADFAQGKILYGKIKDNAKTIDDVIVACESENNLAVNCHGNLLITEQILELLTKNGAKAVGPKQILRKIAKEKYGPDTIAAEAQVNIPFAQTLKGTRIIAYQKTDGLSAKAKEWLSEKRIEKIRAEAKKILADSKTADFFLNKADIILAGGPNSGKSTLFNRLCGREKAIVTEVAGTTRDWISADVKLKNITVRLFDTAGMDKTLDGDIDAESQRRAAELIRKSHLIVNIVDAARPQKINLKTERQITVFNKCDLAAPPLPKSLSISAKTGEGVEKLIEKIEEKLGTDRFDEKRAVCFTERQKDILKKISVSADKKQINESIKQLLNGQLSI